jgi:hypothetical protein
MPRVRGELFRRAADGVGAVQHAPVRNAEFRASFAESRTSHTSSALADLPSIEAYSRPQ